MDERRYKGMTEDVAKRVVHHNLGQNKSTKAFKPWKLVCQEELIPRPEARKSEKFFKSGAWRESLKKKLK